VGHPPRAPGALAQDELTRMQTLFSAPQYDGVDRDVQRNDQYAEADLYIPCETAGIQHRQQVALDEASSVHGLARTATKFVLQWSERAYPGGELNEGAPHGRRYVHPGDTRPPQYEQPPGDYERNEREVDDEGEIGEYRIHRDKLSNKKSGAPFERSA
jgi:hypothetical protein